MARISNIVESMKQQTSKTRRSRRAKSAPSRPAQVAPSETAPTNRTKRARSEASADEQPVRVSKRLRGIAAEKFEDTVAAVNFGGEPMEGVEGNGAVDGEPSRRGKSVPSCPAQAAPSETAPTNRTKRARSEPCADEEPVRVSKRLKGIAAEKSEDTVVAVNFGEEPMKGDDVKGAMDGKPARRAKSVPSCPAQAAPSKTAPTKRNKRARSEPCADEEPVRVSKRLKGIAAEKFKDTVVAVNFGEEPMKGDDVNGAIDGEKRETFGRTLSSVTTTTVAEEEGDLMSTQSTLPDDEIKSPLFPQSPTLTTSVDNNPSKPPPSEKIAISKSAEGMPAQTQETRAEETRPLYTNTVPPPVQIEGHPSLRVLYNSTLLHRKSALLPIHEWQSHHFLTNMIPPHLRETHTAHFQKHGYLVIPNTIFSPAPPTDEPILQIISEFLDRFALPNQPFPTFTTFIDAQTHILNPHAIQWWSQLASYFDSPSHLDHVYNTSPGQWHIVWHSIPTLSVLREFSSVTETLRMRRAKEMVHQELVRRIASARGIKKGHNGFVARLGLIKMGSEQLREISRKFDALDKGVGDCDYCCVKPDFK